MKDNQGGEEATVINQLTIIGSPLESTKMDDFKRVCIDSSFALHCVCFHPTCPACAVFWCENDKNKGHQRDEMCN